jgi:WD40 repeat protein
MKQYPKFSNEISALSFSPDGSKLAIGISYEHDNGVPNAEDREKRQLLVKTTVMDDCKVGDRKSCNETTLADDPREIPQPKVKAA